MGMKCTNCGKGVMYGHNVSHAKNRTRKIFKPNLHVARIMIGGNRRKLRLCTKCLRMFKSIERETRQNLKTQNSNLKSIRQAQDRSTIQI